MTEWQEKAVSAIEAQQEKEQGRTAAWMVGEQLKDICRREPASAELIAQDMAGAAMGIRGAEKKIKAYADQHRTGNFACVTPVEADSILREFYGLPKPEEAKEAQKPIFTGPSAETMVNLEDFI